MSEPAGEKSRTRRNRPDRTTLRTSVSEDEHDAVSWYAKNVCGMTIDDFVRQAVSAYLKAQSGKDLSTMAAASKTRGKLVQEELF